MFAAPTNSAIAIAANQAPTRDIAPWRWGMTAETCCIGNLVSTRNPPGVVSQQSGLAMRRTRSPPAAFRRPVHLPQHHSLAVGALSLPAPYGESNSLPVRYRERPCGPFRSDAYRDPCEKF